MATNVLTSLQLAGGNLAYPRRAGWTVATLESGKQIRMGEHCHNSAIAELESRGIDCTQYSKRLDIWVATAIMPPHEN